MKNLSLIALLMFGSLYAKAAHKTENGFVLRDKVCVVVEGEEPILLSEIERRAQQNGEKILDAKKELIRERLLWVHARKQLKYDVASIFKAADDHIANVIASNKLSREKFEDVLRHPPYSMSLRQFRLDTATEYLKNSVKQSITSQISVSDEQVKKDAAKKFEVVFITLTPPALPKNLNDATRAKALSPQFKKANEIRDRIRSITKVNDIKKLYSGAKDISIIGPMAYERGALKKTYDERLESESTDLVIGPFLDDGSITMIWKTKSKKNFDGTALEKVRKESYHNAVLEKFNAITDALINSSTVIDKGCGTL